MTWHRIRTWRAIYDTVNSNGHILMHTEAGNIETTSLKPEEFHALVSMLNNCDPVFTDGQGKLATGEEVVGEMRPPAG